MMTNYDIFAMALFFVLFFGYHFLFFFLSHTLKKETREHHIHFYREQWMDMIIARKEPILAIQTLRNLIMTNTFLISLTMIMIGGLISIISTKADLFGTLQVIDSLEREVYFNYFQAHPVVIKIFIGIFMLLLSTYNFTIGLRILYNLNFTAPSATAVPEQRQFQKEQLQRQARHFITGIRALYYFFGPMLWIIDTTVMVVFTIVTTIAFLRFDFIPRVKINTKINANGN